MKYCRDLRLAGYSDWKLANMAELQPIYDSTAVTPGLAGPRKMPMTSLALKAIYLDRRPMGAAIPNG